MSLNNKVALITGGSRGIGKAIALELAKNGVNIAISYANNQEKANEVLDEIESYGVKAIAIKANVSVESEVQQMIKQVEEQLNTIDILVNNAGIAKDMLLLRMTEEDWNRVININLKGIFNTSKACVKYMVKQREGKIINISSIIGIYGNAGQVNYAAAKAGIIGFTKSLAKEVGSRGITVNAVAPGFIKTDMTLSLLKKDTEISDKIPLKRVGTPEDVAYTVAFLASKKADYITGHVLAVDGGLTL